MIEERYLNIIMIATYVDGEGKRYVDELWHKDLVRHLNPIRNLVLAAPLRSAGSDATKLFHINHNSFEGTLSYVDLPECRSFANALVTLPKALATLWRAIGEAEIVHIGVGGWPLPYGWFAAPMARLRGKFLLTNLESAAWRLGWARPVRPKGLITGAVYEVMGRLCVNLSDMVTSTQAAYLREMLLPWRIARGHVFSASWIDESAILSREQAEADWFQKLRDLSRPLRAGFAANLLRSKGVCVLLDALRLLERRGIGVNVQVYGKGELFHECAAFASSLSGSVSLTMGGTLPYGRQFFEMLRGQDVVLIPSLTDEQPRLVYDCFSQAIPVIASDTTGLRECVTDSENGKFVPPGDPQALADGIAHASADREKLRAMGIASLDVARDLTHDKMHAQRAAVIQTALRAKRDRSARPHRPQTDAALRRAVLAHHPNPPDPSPRE
jgi:glycosyltransferase involved in cell wall biosynthesis